MSRIILALASFMVGACSMALFGNHTSMAAQEPAPHLTPPPEPTGCGVKGFTADGGTPGSQNRLIRVRDASPTVPGMSQKICGALLSNGTQSLDGLNCADCTFTGVSLEYSGGAYSLENAHFGGVTQIVLKGAAANTVAILPLLQAISSGQAPEQPAPNTPIIKTANTEKVRTVSFVSPYGK